MALDLLVFGFLRQGELVPRPGGGLADFRRRHVAAGPGCVQVVGLPLVKLPLLLSLLLFVNSGQYAGVPLGNVREFFLNIDQIPSFFLLRRGQLLLDLPAFDFPLPLKLLFDLLEPLLLFTFPLLLIDEQPRLSCVTYLLLSSQC